MSADSAADALQNAHGAIVTDWDEVATLDDAFQTMANPVVVDGRRIVGPTEDLVYDGLTW